MSDYMFMLESHLNPNQNRVISAIQKAASEANLSLFLTGGAMRDMLGGFQIRDLDFTVEGNGLKLARTLAAKSGIELLSSDETKKSAELRFPGGVTAEIAMARSERYSKPGKPPRIAPATIQEDLRRRDFTMNAIALSLNRGSKGLLIDPLNGSAELARREIRTAYSTALYDDPSRILRLIRLRVRFGFEVEERTKAQLENARLEGLEKLIPPRTLGEELLHMADEPSPAEVLKALEQEALLTLFSPALQGSKLNLDGITMLERARRFWPPEADMTGANAGPFLFALTEKLTPKEKAALIKSTGLTRAEVNAWQGLPAKARKSENILKSATLRKPSQIYHAVARIPSNELLFLLYQSQARLVQDRIKNYFQKYLQTAQEVTEADVVAAGAEPGSPKFQKVRDNLVAARLDGRARKPVPPPVVLPPEPIVRRGRRSL
jgi:tRNA nucleotidyltransferase/poly(A) polymerase